ncbi:hypothetical protein G6F55_012757 [Rhizopus delemar]|uniref:NmrA-like domain-containing protein n=2 Tax=Rhizopus TaxID=4842 RepID=A0A9P7CJZ0_9FUNG|nr:hypothetical protein G6F55_012757 [Rhizopus delemar]KAG1537767.1 hypothetical protein G6F51_010172 [Rhizopus arrhizus]KAG1554915.1 hypothetical protein G6F49_007609 [Rhizopus delemar]KAG1565485.1 hypothetical protein G6F50_010027 [Rhizopus delemar]KAG1613354.1 hypothetical protein G6F45_012808 [Rhizopus arrhizus]
MHTTIITNGDSLLGYAVAFKFLTTSKSESRKYRIFCREKQTLKELELLGAEVIETDYKDEALMCRMLRGVSYIMLVPEYSSNRIKEAQLIMECAKKEKVDYMTLFS